MSYRSKSDSYIVHWNRLSDWLDKWLFFTTFLLGVGGIIGFKVIEANTAALIWAVFVMISYALYVMMAKHYILRADKAGDNLYYLGFLFTLSSLAYSLFLFSTARDATSAILTNFGLALATTILGLALRIMFNQMREDPVEIEREARSDLAEAVSKLKVELHNTIMEFNSFRRAMVQSLSEGMDDLSNASNTALENSTQRFAKVVDAATDDIENSFAKFRENQEKLNSLSWAAVVATDDLFRKIRGIDVPNDLFKNKLDSIMEKSAGLHDDLLAQLSVNANEDLSAARAHREAMASELKESRRLLNELHQSLNSVTATTAEKNKKA